MTERSNEKIKVILEKLLEEHSLGVSKPQNINILEFDILAGTNVQARNLNSIFEHLKEQKLLIDWIDNDGEFVMFFPDNFREQAPQYLNTLEKVTELNPDKQESSFKLQVLEEKGKVYLVYRNKKACISTRNNTRKAKLIKCLSFPEFGTLKTIDVVAEEIKLAGEEYDQYTDKRALIDTTIKEIQRKLKEDKFPVRFKSNFENGSVSMPIDKHKSG